MLVKIAEAEKKVDEDAAKVSEELGDVVTSAEVEAIAEDSKKQTP